VLNPTTPDMARIGNSHRRSQARRSRRPCLLPRRYAKRKGKSPSFDDFKP
jgi:hypothetical protein